MSHTIAPLSDLRGLADEQLAALFATADDIARKMLRAECERRDRLERLAQARKRIYDEWYMQARAQYEAADRECNGELVNDAPGWPKARGDQPGRDDFALWTLPEREAMRFATWELKDWWRINGRLSWDAYRRQRAADMRAAREDARSPITDMTDYESAWTTEGSRDEQHTAERAAVDGHAAAAVRHVGERPAAYAVRGAGRGRDAGSVRPAGRTVTTVTAPVAPGQAEARAAGCLHPRTKFGTPGQCGDCPAGRLQRAASAPTVPMLPARRDSAPPAPTGGSVAVRQPHSVPGDQLLDTVRKWLGMYARYPSPAALDAITLWVAHSHCRDQEGTLVFRATPRLFLLSSEPGSGKSRVLELLGLLCPATFGLDLEPTPAGLTYTIAREHATVLIDEADVMFGAGARKASVRAIINGGYTRHGTILTGKGSKATRVPVFGALALAGLDTLEKGTGDTLTALLSRGIKIRMTRAPKGDAPAKITRVTEAQGAQLAQWLAGWAAQERDGLADAQPEVPDGVDGRPGQIWEPLLAVAEAAGGDWPARARAACLELMLAARAAEDDDAPPVTAQLADFAAALGAGLEYDDEEEWIAEDGGDASAPLTPAPPAYGPPPTYRAFVAVQGQGTRPLVCDVTDPAFARAVCESTAEARALGRPLRWVESADGKAWTAQGETDAVAWAVAAE